MNKQVRFIARNSWLWNRCLSRNERSRVKRERERGGEREINREKTAKTGRENERNGITEGEGEIEGRRKNIGGEESIIVCLLVLIIEVGATPRSCFIRFELRHALPLTIARRTLVSTWCLHPTILFVSSSDFKTKARDFHACLSSRVQRCAHLSFG